LLSVSAGLRCHVVVLSNGLAHRGCHCVTEVALVGLTHDLGSTFSRPFLKVRAVVVVKQAILHTGGRAKNRNSLAR
jgi:hypothetical protein